MREVNWSRWFGLASYARASLWIVPFVAIVLELVFSRFIQGLDRRLGWTLLGLAVPGASVLYQTIITMTMSFMVFTFGSLLVAIQVASGQLTPRVIATTLLRDNTVRYTVGLFVFTLLYTLRAYDRMESTVQQFSVMTSALLGLACLVAFLYLIDYAARLLRPATIVWRVGQSGIAVLEAVHPRTLGEAYRDSWQPGHEGEPEAIVLHEGTSGTVLAVNQQVLVAEAELHGGMIEFVPTIGDFVATDEPLFRLYGRASAIPGERLRAAVAIGPERTMEQDPTFAFRILIDIALRALSNMSDPTTAVLAIDQIHRLLRAVGKRHLLHDQIVDRMGRVAVIIRTPNWEDYVHLACREIRMHGAGSIQIVRRLRAMIENLIGTLPELRHNVLLRELDLLDRAVQNTYRFPEDLVLARTADTQGMGGVATRAPGERPENGKMADAA